MNTVFFVMRNYVFKYFTFCDTSRLFHFMLINIRVELELCMGKTLLLKVRS